MSAEALDEWDEVDEVEDMEDLDVGMLNGIQRSFELKGLVAEEDVA